MIGTTIAHYRITAKLGEGGMGAVYRATDTKLGRDVAIKVLPDTFAQDPDRMARFQREAQVLASLNHPNIAAIYGVEDRALIMELVEGEDLAGPVPVNKAIDYAHQLTGALSAAHDKGIIHRDLKPANIKITPDGVVKVLDFGLAKAIDTNDTPTSINSPTVVAGTMAGVIMGTAAYMAPEQARGQVVDKRADIWAFGVVLFEVLTGKPLFGGETVSDTLASVMKDEIDFSTLPKDTPSNIRTLLKRCLERDRKKRLRDLGDAWMESPTPSPAQRASVLPWALFGMMTLLFALALWSPWKKPATLPQLHFDIDTGYDDVSQLAVSPDGLRIAFVSGGRLLIRRLDRQNATPLPGTEGASYPFFSPDSQWVAFFSGGRLRKITVEGGAAIAVCDAPSGRGGSWSPDGSIVAALSSSGGLQRVPASGGVTQPLTDLKLETARIISHRWPQVLPGGRGILFSAWNGARGTLRVLPASGGQAKTLIEDASYGKVLPTGRLLYHQQDGLYSVPFNLERLELTGSATPLVDGVDGLLATGFGGFDLSSSGTLVYKPAIRNRRSVSWLDSSNATERLSLKPGLYFTPRLSPDGKRLALPIGQDGKRNIWVYEFAREVLTQITLENGIFAAPAWSADGEVLAFADGGLSGGLAWTRSTGGAKVERYSERAGIPASFSADGNWLVFSGRSAESDQDLWAVPVERLQSSIRLGSARPLLKENGNQLHPTFSPDGRWIAYHSDESGRSQVYVIPFSPNGGAASGKWQVSNDGGGSAVWSKTGSELFYLNPQRRIMSATYTTTGGTFVPGKSRLWSDRQLAAGANYSTFDVGPDGKRVIAILDESDAKPDRLLRVLVNVDLELLSKGGK